MFTRGPSVSLDVHQDVCSSFHSAYRDGRHTDVVLVVDGREFRAHKLILATQSSFFETMFYNSSMLESSMGRVELKETDSVPFGLMLDMVYSGSLQFAEQHEPATLIEVYFLLERYQFVKLAHTILFEIAAKLLSPHNFWKFLDHSIYCKMRQFVEMCFEYFDSREYKPTKSSSTSSSPCSPPVIFHPLLSSDDFTTISHKTLKVVLKRNLNCQEVDLLRATYRWVESKGNSITSAEKCFIFKQIRLSLIPEYELYKLMDQIDYNDLNEAVSSIHLYLPNIIKFYIDSQKGSKRPNKHSNTVTFEEERQARNFLIKSRSIYLPNFNVCLEEFGYTINSSASEDAMEIDTKAVEQSVFLTICLRFPFKLNKIEMKMSDTRGDKYSYLIEYSIDGFKWLPLYDYRPYLCSNLQVLYFNPTVARYFRLSGLHQKRLDNTTRKVFHSIISFKAYYMDIFASVDVVRHEGVLNCPYYSSQIKHRVYCDTTVDLTPNERYYCCQKIATDSNNNPLNGNISTVFKGFRPIHVMFDQPITMNAFAFKLYSIGDSAYSYIVEIFANKEPSRTYEIVADRSTERCTGWQNVFFSGRPVNVIRITGTQIHNSNCQEFRIVKFNFASETLKP